MPAPIQAVWFKRDLRLSDHEPLYRAARAGPILPIYVVETKYVALPDFDALHWNFIRESLTDMEEHLLALGGQLLWDIGDCLERLESWRKAYGFRHLWAHEETGNQWTFERDKAVRRWAKTHNIDFRECPTNGVVRGLRNRDGWSRTWENRMAQPLYNLPEQTTWVEFKKQSRPLPSAADLSLQNPNRCGDLRGGRRQGISILKSFVDERGTHYSKELSSPNTAPTSCSRISPYLTWGCLSMKEVVRYVRSTESKHLPHASARAFLSRCHWHCHFVQKLEDEPDIEFHPFNRECESLRPITQRSRELLDAWMEGQTGYPMIDACMRFLKTIGWINFRMRALLVSFAAYHLWIDWRLFKDFLARQFIDYEPGIHFSQLQMQSGVTGINTLRIYNPTKQGHDHDPQGAFIHRWVPQLRPLTAPDCHDPENTPEMIAHSAGFVPGKSYPLPVVNHAEAIRHARAAFANLRKSDAFRLEAQKVYQRHGSRSTRRDR